MAKKPAKSEDGKKEGAKPAPPPVPRLQTRFEKEIIPALAEKLGRPNRLSLPRIEKIVVSMGVGTATADKKHMEEAVAAMAEITGQKPLRCKSKKSIANFRLREGLEVGCKVTLRGARMYEFLDRFINVAVPRMRDFRGLPNRSFDGRGNYSFGIKEQMVFPEIDFDKVEQIHGMDITIVTTAGRDDLALALLRQFGWPFRGETPVRVG